MKLYVQIEREEKKEKRKRIEIKRGGGKFKNILGR